RHGSTEKHSRAGAKSGRSLEMGQALAVGVPTRAALVDRDRLETEPPRRRILEQPETGHRHCDFLRIRRHEVATHIEHLRLAMPADLEPFANADVPRNDVAPGRHPLNATPTIPGPSGGPK